MTSGGAERPAASLCCIPVSWPTGLGELARQLTLADAARRRAPELRCHFVLNRHLTPAARQLVPTSCTVTWLDTSPTNDDAGVAAALEQSRPDLVFFDNAGSGAQCRRASELGAHTVFLSTRAATQARGFGAPWLPWLDEHWLIGPRALAAPLPPDQRAAAAAHGILVRSFDAVYAPSDPARRSALRRALGCAARPYVCFIPGGGGGTVDGRPAITVFAETAALVAHRADVACVLLLGPLAPEANPPDADGVIAHRATHAETVDLMTDARLVVLGASSSLFQALAQKKVCVATGAGGDEQLQRARDWAARGIVAAADPRPAELAAAVAALLADDARYRALAARVAALGVENHLRPAVDAIAARVGIETR